MGRVWGRWQGDCVARAAERTALLREELTRWRVYQHGSRLLRRVLRWADPDPDPDPDGVTSCALGALRRSAARFKVGRLRSSLLY